MKNILNRQNIQRLNYDAEGQKYAALQSNINAIAQGLAGIGKENAVMNMINSNPYLQYKLRDDFTQAYNKALGGFLKKYKKK